MGGGGRWLLEYIIREEEALVAEHSENTKPSVSNTLQELLEDRQTGASQVIYAKPSATAVRDRPFRSELSVQSSARLQRFQ